MKKKILLVVALVVLTSVYILTNKHLSENKKAVQDSGAVAMYATDFNNPRSLVGFAQNVFAAKVFREVGTVPATPYTSHIQYEAEVIYNIKGNASGKVVVDLEVTQDRSLAPGSTYLVAAHHSGEDTSWYYLGSHPARVTVISNDVGLTSEQLSELVRKHTKTYELLNAYPNEILLQVDIRNGYTQNSFQSLSDEGKSAVYAKFAELIPPRPVPEILPPPSPLPPRVNKENTSGVCRDGKDNDEDGLTDKADPDCTPVLREDKASRCGDGIDNDGDGLLDSADPDCAPFYPTPTPPPPPSPPTMPTSTPPAPAPSSTPVSTQ